MQNLLISQGEDITSQLRLTLPQKFTNPFSYVPCRFCREAASEVIHYIEGKPQWHNELQQGKMFGVLVVETSEGKLGYLAAFSGNLQGQNNLDFFVPPVYDLLNPDKFFKVGEREISAINARIASIEGGDEMRVVKSEIAAVKEKYGEILEGLKRAYKEGKIEREKLRQNATPGILEHIARESQFQKAEIKRGERGMKEALQPLKVQLQQLENEIASLKELRKSKSAALQEEIFRKFSFLNARGEQKDMPDIFSDFYKEQSLREGRAILPPGGAGECAAPKLLQYAFLHGMRPVSMGEFWWGNSPKGEVRRHGEFYPSCKGKCAPILSFMLQGLPVETELFHISYGSAGDLQIIYSDEYILAVNKPAGLLSVPGKEVKDEVGERVVHHFSDNKDFDQSELYVVHRLDMHTSGVLVMAKNAQIYKELQQLFAERKVEKCYKAVLEGVVTPQQCGGGVVWESETTGIISLPLAADYNNRPAQKVDFEFGKEAITKFEITAVRDGRTYINFYPVTGRTHQLRVHSAHKEGLNVPIVGDLLYGTPDKRLMLHAEWIKFHHPIIGEMHIRAELPDII